MTQNATFQGNTKNTDEGDVCPRCRGLGYLTPDVPAGHPDFGRVIPCPCRQGEIEKRRARRLLEMSNLGMLAQHTFASFNADGVALNEHDRRNLRNAFEAAKQFADQPEGWLLISGTYGCGKTHLAAAITVALAESGRAVLFQVVPDLLDHLRATYAPRSPVAFDQVFLDVRQAPCLVLDDLGAQNATPWALEKLYQILNHRYNNRLPTVITTNAPLEDMDPRLRSRLTDESLVRRVAITAPDYRGSGASSPLSDLNALSLHADKTFEAFDVRRGDLDADQRRGLQEAVAATVDYASNPRGFLVLLGPSYTGKTHLAAAIANARVGQGYPALLVSVSDLLDYLRAAFEPAASISFDKRLQQLRRAPLLILDNLGGQTSTPWAHEKLYQLVTYRIDAGLPTVITTRQKLEEMEPSLKARLMDKAHGLIVPVATDAYPGRTAARAPRRRKQL